jgi:Reverse transcriptase (RNA-dependent DNA polymerase)
MVQSNGRRVKGTWKKYETWTITQLPKNKKLVGCKWVYKIKYNSDGIIKRYKTRLVVKGYTQTYGINYEETIAPVTKMNTVKILFSLVVNQNWTLYQLDVRNTFLQGTLEEEIYMILSPRHKKEVYGLKQSPWVWYGKLSNYLIFYDFKVSNADHSLFFKIDKNYTTIILVYVDDIIVTENNLEEIIKVKAQLKENFNIKDLELLKYFFRYWDFSFTKGLIHFSKKICIRLVKRNR